MAAPLPGYTLRPAPDGMGIELIPPVLREHIFLARFLAFFGLTWTGLVLSVIVMAVTDDPAHSRFNNGAGAPGWDFFLMFALIGLGVLALAFYGSFYNTLYLTAGTGWIARRGRIPLLNRPWERKYHNIVALEILHGIWDDYTASSDTLRLRTHSAKRPVTLRKAQHFAGFTQLHTRLTDSATGKPDWRQVARHVFATPPPDIGPVEIAPEIAALGDVLSQTTGIKLTLIEKVIPTPSRGGNM